MHLKQQRLRLWHMGLGPVAQFERSGFAASEKHIGRACSSRPLLFQEDFPASDFTCSSMQGMDFTLELCYCNKEFCNRGMAVLMAKTARLFATEFRNTNGTNTLTAKDGFDVNEYRRNQVIFFFSK